MLGSGIKKLKREIRIEFACVLFSILKSATEHNIKLTPKSAGGFTTGPKMLEACLVAYFESRSDYRRNSSDPGKAFCVDLSKLMAELSTPGHIFSANATSIAADVSWYLLRSHSIKPATHHMSQNDWMCAVSTTRGIFSGDLIENRKATYARLLRKHWRSIPRQVDLQRAYDDVLRWARRSIDWAEDFITDMWGD